MDSRELATEIRRQLNVGGRARNNVMCWGANAYRYGEDKKKNLGFLQFKVSGLLFKGIVKISLAFNDTYTVEFIKNKRVKNVMLSDLYGRNKFDTVPVVQEKMTMTDIYCDSLNMAIHNKIEEKY
jgi:hypothetical protein